jgi:hypothetical protein
MVYRLALLALTILFIPTHVIAQTEADLFDASKLQELRIDIHPADWAQLKATFLENTYYACVFHWIFNGKDIASAEVGLRSRGTGSRSGIKPSLLLQFDRYESRQQFLGLKSLVLRGNTQDASMMHERVAMEVLRRMGLAAPREAHAKVYVNGEYSGLYTIVESIDKSFLKSRFGEEGRELYNYQHHGPFYLEDRGVNPAIYSPVPFEPEFPSEIPNPAPIAGMIQAINYSTDSQFQTAVSQFVDLKEFLTEVAAENFLAEEDGLVGDFGLNNFYLYRFNGKNVHTFIPWDKSNTFFAMDWPIMRNVQWNVLTKRALAIPELLTLYRNQLALAASIAGGPGGWLEQEIQREYAQIRDAAYADPVRVCDPTASGTLRPCTIQEFELAITNMVAFARRRALDVQIQLAGGISQQTFTINSSGAFTTIAAGTSDPIKIGYARIQPGAVNTFPAGLAILGLREKNILVSESSVPASPLIQSGRMYAEVSGPVNTGLAIANPNDQAASITFYFTDPTGRDYGSGRITIPANGQISQFLSDSPFSSGTLTMGTFTFNSSVPVGAVGLRVLTNERSELLITTLRVSPIVAESVSLSFPQFVDGGGWATQVILINPGDRLLTGTVRFSSLTPSNFTYSIPVHGAFRLQTAGTSTNVTVGSIRIVPDTNTNTPAGVSIFSYRSAGVTMTQTGVPPVRDGSAFRLYVESSGDFGNARTGSTRTGVAIANSAATPAVVSLELTNLDGTSTGLAGTITIPANWQTSLFLNQLPGLSGVPASFQGILRVSGTGTVAVTGLRMRYNERSEFLLTSIPAVDEAQTSDSELVFPDIVEGGGFTTQFVLFGAQRNQASSGTLRFLDQTGKPLILNIDIWH